MELNKITKEGLLALFVVLVEHRGIEPLTS